MNKPPFERALTAEELAALPDETIDYSDIPELGDDFFDNAVLVRPDPTRQITLRLKGSVLDAYKATGKGYHSRMNAVLEDYARRVLKTGG